MHVYTHSYTPQSIELYNKGSCPAHEESTQSDYL